MNSTNQASRYGVADIANLMTVAGRLNGGDPESLRYAIRTSGIGSIEKLVEVLDDPDAVQRLKVAADSMHRNPNTTSKMTTEHFGEILRALLIKASSQR